MTPAALALIETAVREERDRVPDGATLAGVGWTTVEFERAVVELSIETSDAPGDVALGARCWFAAGATASPLHVPLVLLEPSTDARLAASLARLGEGPAVTWWDVDTIEGWDAAPSSAGPLGPAHLLSDETRRGRFRFLRPRRAATING